MCEAALLGVPAQGKAKGGEQCSPGVRERTPPGEGRPGRGSGSPGQGQHRRLVPPRLDSDTTQPPPPLALPCSESCRPGPAAPNGAHPRFSFVKPRQLLSPGRRPRACASTPAGKGREGKGARGRLGPRLPLPRPGSHPAAAGASRAASGPGDETGDGTWALRARLLPPAEGGWARLAARAMAAEGAALLMLLLQLLLGGLRQRRRVGPADPGCSAGAARDPRGRAHTHRSGQRGRSPGQEAVGPRTLP